MALTFATSHNTVLFSARIALLATELQEIQQINEELGEKFHCRDCGFRCLTVVI